MRCNNDTIYPIRSKAQLSILLIILDDLILLPMHGGDAVRAPAEALNQVERRHGATVRL